VVLGGFYAQNGGYSRKDWIKQGEKRIKPGKTGGKEAKTQVK